MKRLPKVMIADLSHVELIGGIEMAGFNSLLPSRFGLREFMLSNAAVNKRVIDYPAGNAGTAFQIARVHAPAVLNLLLAALVELKKIDPENEILKREFPTVPTMNF